MSPSPINSRAVPTSIRLRRKTLDRAREVLAGIREQRASRIDAEQIAQWIQKSQEADRKYEEASVKNEKGEPEAERLYTEAIAGWEDVLPHATAEDYRKATTASLFHATLRLGQFQRRKGDRTASAANLKKAIDYGEKAIALDPSRPLLQHNLRVARGTLEILRDEDFGVEVEKLAKAGRFAEVVERYNRNVEEMDRRVRGGDNPDLVVPILAARLERFAWLLAHCPDRQVRDTGAAVSRAGGPPS